MKCLKLGFLLCLATTFASGCSTLWTRSSVVKDSTLSDLNPPPSALNPPSMDESKDLTVDPVYMRSQADYHFTMGEAYSLEGKSQKAVDEFKLTLVYDPDSVMLRLRLAAEYLRLGLASEAVEQAEAAVAKDPQNADARLLLGGLYTSMKMLDQALGQYRELLKAHPDEPDANFYVGAILAEQKHYDLAVQHFMHLTETSKEEEQKARAWYYVARIRIEQGEGRYKAAEKAFTQALSIKADYVEVVIGYAAFLKDTKREKESVALLESYQRHNGPDKEVAKYLSRIYLDREDFEHAYTQLEIIERFERDNLNARIQLALILIEQQRYAEAASRLEDILVLAPDLDKIRYYLGAVYEQTGKPELAVKQYGMVPPESSYYADAMIHAAFISKQAGDLGRAKELMVTGIKEREDIAQFYAFYASLLDDTKEYRKAVELLAQAVEKFPTHTQLRFFLGSMQDRVGNTKETVTQMQRVLELDGNHVQAMNYLAYTYAELNENLDAAEELARKAMSIQPGDGYILDTVGWVMFKKGKVSEAIKYLEAAYSAKSDEAIIAEHLGDAYLRNDMFDKALEMYRRAAARENDVAKQEKIKQKIANIDHQFQPSDADGRQPAALSGGKPKPQSPSSE